MTVSVVMITFKHERFIEQALQSILDQDYPYLKEIIVSDDCSPDETKYIVDSLIDSHPKGNLINYIRHKKNIGFQKNFKFALEKAKGDFIALCEGDDFWNTTAKLSIQLEVFREQPHTRLVASKSYICNAENQLREQSDKYSNIIFPYTLTINNFLEPYVLDTNTLIFRNDISLKHIPAKGFKDIVLIALVLENGNGILLEDTHGTYRLHETGNWTAKNIDEKYIENLISVTLMYKLFKAKHDGLYKFIRNCYRHAYVLLLDKPGNKIMTLKFAPVYYAILKKDWSFNRSHFFRRLFLKLFK